MKLNKLLLLGIIVISLFFTAPYLTTMQPQQPPQTSAVTLTQEAKIFLFAFMLGPCMILVEHLESSSLAVMGLEQIPFMGKFVRIFPLSLILGASFIASGSDINDVRVRQFLIALSGFMLGWTIAESLWETGGRVSVESFFSELLGNFKDLDWRFGVMSTFESNLSWLQRFIFRYVKKTALG